MTAVMVCVGAGRGERFGGDKLAADLGGRSVLETSLAALKAAFPDTPMVVVLPPSRSREWRLRLRRSFPEVGCVVGGDRRQDSVRKGVAAVAGAEVVAIHDAARPLVAPEDVRRVVAAVATADGAVLVGRIADTVKQVDGAGRVVSTLDRDRLRAAQTPQAFRREGLERAWRECDLAREWTDEAAMLEACGLEVVTVEARRPNPKITTPADLTLAVGLMEVWR